jgi:hypothetical protein
MESASSSPKTALINPERATVDLDTGCARLWFPEHSIAPSGHYLVAGGICWPMLVDNVFKGCAIIAARSVETGIVYVFDQREFSCVEHVLARDGGIQIEGLAPWFVRNWANFYATRYYWFQADEYERLFRLRVHRCELIQPKPSLIPTHWKDDTHSMLIISDMLEQQKLKLKAGPILNEMAQQQADPKMGPFPALHSLACLLTGLSIRRAPAILPAPFEPTISIL